MADKVQLHVWVPAEIKAGAQAYADERGISLAAAVNLLLREALQRTSERGWKQ
jgi:antitoxin component of RelBE/YafQ-DinJ toxin-antitoxin module